MKTRSSKPGRNTSETDLVRPLRARYEDDHIVIECSDGQTVRFPAAENPVLRHASPEQLGNVECSPFGLHWPDLDEDLSLAGILQKRFGQRGGVRPGAGRPPSGRVQYVTRLKPTTISWIKAEAKREGKDECAFVERALESARRGLFGTDPLPTRPGKARVCRPS